MVIQDNPSRDFFFPITGAEAVEFIRRLPEEPTRGITHLRLRRMRHGESRPLAEYIRGSGARVVILYPARKDRGLCLGKHRPGAKLLGSINRFWWHSAL